MFGYSVFLFATIVASIMEKCTTRYFLVKIGDAGERTRLAKSNLTVDLLKELNVEKDSRGESLGLEWLHFQHLETGRYIGNPKRTTDGFGVEWDGGNLVFGKSSAGEHTFTDLEGIPLKLSDVKDGMSVKIRARTVHWIDYEYLFTSENTPAWGYCYYDKNRYSSAGMTKDNKKQLWRVDQRDPSDPTFAFESRFWSAGKGFLSGKTGDWLYTDDFRRRNKWKVTPSSI